MTKKKVGPHGKHGRPSLLSDKRIWKLAQTLYNLGKTDLEVAEILEVKEQTINNWKKADPSFFEALKDWKLNADRNVEKSLFERATGYSHPDVHISNYQGFVTETPITKHYAPDVTACIFWLKNRQPKEWRDKVDHQHTGENGGPIKYLIDKALDPEEFAKQYLAQLDEKDV